MDSSDREKLRTVISNKITELQMVVQSDASSSGNIELDQTRVGRLARMDAVQHHAIAQVQTDRAAKQLRLLRILFSKIDRDDFGECHACGDDIAIGRLLVRPESLRCIECADLMD